MFHRSAPRNINELPLLLQRPCGKLLILNLLYKRLFNKKLLKFGINFRLKLKYIIETTFLKKIKKSQKLLSEKNFSVLKITRLAKKINSLSFKFSVKFLP